jgi:solute carrier family 25 S-adenosylmethionine transporter 26
MLDMRVCLYHASPASMLTSGQNPAVEKLPSLFSRFQDILRAEGPTAFFQGAVPRTGWIAVGGAVFLGVYERVISGLMVADI